MRKWAGAIAANDPLEQMGHPRLVSTHQTTASSKILRVAIDVGVAYGVANLIVSQLGQDICNLVRGDGVEIGRLLHVSCRVLCGNDRASR